MTGAATSAAPRRDTVGRPLGRAVPMAARARVRHADRHGQVGPRDAEAVVSARIDHHVRARGHMTADATGALRPYLMVVVARRIELRRHVTLSTDGVARLAKLPAL